MLAGNQGAQAGACWPVDHDRMMPGHEARRHAGSGDRKRDGQQGGAVLVGTDRRSALTVAYPGATLRIVVDGESVLRAGPRSVDYVEDDGLHQVQDLARCNSNYQSRRPSAVGELSYVGWRHLMSPEFYVEFAADPPVCFRFNDADDAYERLLSPLEACGWFTIDRT